MENLFAADEAIVKYLLEQGADVNAQKDVNGHTPLHRAAIQGNQTIVACLVKAKANVNAQDKEGRTPLHFAAYNGNEAMAICLVKAKANVNIQSKNGQTPLHWAVMEDHEAIVACLVKAKANVNAQENVSGQTPLHWAAMEGQEAIVACLVKAKADVNAQDKEGRTPLHWAALKGYQAVVKYLIEHDANMHILNEESETPLYCAIVKRHISITQLLLAKRAYRAKDIKKIEETAENWMRDWKQQDSLEEDKIARGTTMLLAGLPMSDEVLPEALKSVKARISEVVKQDLSPLKLSKENIPQVLQALPKLIPCVERGAERVTALLFSLDQASLPAIPEELRLMIQEALGDIEIIDQPNTHFGNTLLCDCIKHLEKYKALQTKIWQRDWNNDISIPHLSSLAI